MQSTETSYERSFTIIEPNPVVSMDLVGALQSAFPGSHIDVMETVGDVAVRDLVDKPSMTILLSSTLISETALQALREKVARGARLVFIGDVDLPDFPVGVVSKPFSTQTLLDALV